MGNALAVRQISWMDTFQKYVAEQQEKIRAIERVQVPYMCIQDALEDLADMRIDTFKLSIMDQGVFLSFTADDRTTREEYWRVYKAVHDALVMRKKIQAGAGTYPAWNNGLSCTGTFYVKDALHPEDYKLNVRVYVTMNIPEEGTYNIEVKKSFKQYSNSYEVYSLSYKDELEEPPYQLGSNPKDIF